MAHKKIDGLVEVVRYSPSGLIDIVRVYEKRGPTFTDRILLDRQALLARLKEGKKFVTGSRVPQMSSSFEVNSSIKLVKTPLGEFITTGEFNVDRDELKETPLF